MRHSGGRVDERTHRVGTHQADVTGFGFSEDVQFGLGDLRLLDTTHQGTAVYYRTSWNCTGAGVAPPRDPAGITIPMGHTDLYVEEKRAVIVRGRVRAVWPQAFQGGHMFRLLVAGASLREALVVGPGDAAGFGDVVKNAVRLSDLTDRPVLVSRQLARHYWH